MANEQLRYQVSCSTFPLARYREVAAHLQQVDGVKVDLIPQSSHNFDYCQSQISGLWIEYTRADDLKSRERVREILAYYQLDQEE